MRNFRTSVLPLAIFLCLTTVAFAQDQGVKPKPVVRGGIAGSQQCAALCASDVIADGFTNVDDLLAVVNHWGFCVTCPPTFCTGDVNQDCWINVDDLLAVINGWGPCPAPANDNCANYANLPGADASIPFCTKYATTDGPSAAGCNFLFNDPQVHKDIWYGFSTSQFASNYWQEIDTCGSEFDTKIAVYRFDGVNGCNCGSLSSAQLVTCNDDANLNGCNLQSRVIFQLVNNSCYRIRVGGYNGDSGAGVVNARSFVRGDECLNAIDIGVVTSTTALNVVGNNFPAGNFKTGWAVPQAPCTSFPDGLDVWYKFQIGCGGNVIGSVNTCDPTTDFDTILTLYRGTCDGLILVGCNDDYTGNPGCQLNGLYRKSLVDLPTAASAGYYYVRVSGYQGAWGSFRLRVGLSCIN